MYELFYTNMGFKSEESFTTIDKALVYGRKKGLEFSILDANGATVAYYTAFGGVHYTSGVGKYNDYKEK